MVLKKKCWILEQSLLRAKSKLSFCPVPRARFETFWTLNFEPWRRVEFKFQRSTTSSIRRGTQHEDEGGLKLKSNEHPKNHTRGEHYGRGPHLRAPGPMAHPNTSHSGGGTRQDESTPHRGPTCHWPAARAGGEQPPADVASGFTIPLAPTGRLAGGPHPSSHRQGGAPGRHRHAGPTDRPWCPAHGEVGPRGCGPGRGRENPSQPRHCPRHADLII